MQKLKGRNVMARILQNILSFHNSKDKSHRIITILGLKLKFRKYSTRKDIENIKRAMYQYINPAMAPSATGDLRLLQLANIQALSIFDKICEKLQLEYWIDYGTLLGAERHKGFIPWDDDVDLGMNRENFEKAKKLLPKELEKYGFVVNTGKGYYHPIIRIIYKNTAVQLDIFPYDYIKINKNNIEKLSHSINLFHEDFADNYIKKIKSGIINFDISMLQPYYKKLRDLYDENGVDVYYRGVESIMELPLVIPANTIFPIKKQVFDGLYLNAPNNPAKYLELLYGEYLKMPPLNSTQHSDIMKRLKNAENILLELKKLNEEIR